MKRFNALSCRLALFMSATLLTACASQGGNNYSTRTEIPSGTDINAQVVTYSLVGPDVGSKGEEALGTAGEYAGIGAGAGLYGGFEAGLACGPLFIVCSPFLGASMAVVGGVVGGVGGAVVGAYKGLPKETAELLEQSFSRYVNSNDFESDIDTAFVDSVDSKWNITDGEAHSSVDITIQYLGSAAVNDESVSLQVVLGMQLRQGSEPSAPTKTYLFSDNQTVFVEDMLANDGDNIRSSLQSAFLRISNQMVLLLEQAPRP